MVPLVRIGVPPLKKILENREIPEGSGSVAGAHLLQPYCSRNLAEGFVHRSCRRVTHSWEHVAVGVEGDRYGGVTEEFLDDLGVNAPVRSNLARPEDSEFRGQPRPRRGGTHPARTWS